MSHIKRRTLDYHHALCMVIIDCSLWLLVLPSKVLPKKSLLLFFLLFFLSFSQAKGSRSIRNKSKKDITKIITNYMISSFKAIYVIPECTANKSYAVSKSYTYRYSLHNKTDYGPGKAFELNTDTPVWCCAAYFVAIFLIVSKLYQTSLKAWVFVVKHIVQWIIAYQISEGWRKQFWDKQEWYRGYFTVKSGMWCCVLRQRWLVQLHRHNVIRIRITQCV